VLIASFALDEGEKAGLLFGDLARRMEDLPELKVCFLVNVHRKYQDETPSSTLLRQFAQRWRDRGWPGRRLPELFYDPRSLEMDPQKRAVMHAKVLVVDGRWALVSSANFTEAAQERNMEAGVLVEDVRFSERVERQFSELVEEGIFRRVPGVENVVTGDTGANEGKKGPDREGTDHD
jgi:phosphatidylserine/phosphatidylglycerophosphate/cardiolipin synthase-like enzyme